MSLTDRALRVGMNAAKRLSGRCVTYSGKRGNQPFSIAGIRSIRTTSEHVAETDDQMTVSLKIHDELIDVCDLRIGDEQIEPQLGDKVTEQIGPRSVTYAINMPAGFQVFSYSDPARTRYRIHIQQVI